MHILLTNDDGYQAAGIAQLVKTLQAAGHRISVSAPDRERSAASHGLSITAPLRVKNVVVEGAKGWAVDGTPADCVRLGMYLLRDDKPELCISGINQGSNLGGACIYSGTVHSAMEASMSGCPAIAASMDSYTDKDFAAAAEKILAFISYAVAHPLERGEIYNVNVPAGKNLKAGYYFTDTLGPDYLTDAGYESFTAANGVTYYVLNDGPNYQYYPPECDSIKCREGETTVSVLSWNLAVSDKSRLPRTGKMDV